MQLQLRCDIRKLPFLQLGLPENRVHIVESMVNPALFLDMVQVDVSTGEGITVGSSQNTPPAELEGLLLGQVVAILGVEDTVGEGLTGSDTEEVTWETGAVGVDVIEGWAFLGSHLCLLVKINRLCVEIRTPANMVPILRP